MSNYKVLARKWRPRSFEEIVGQPHAVRALTNALSAQYLHHGYLFTGARGVGKTTIARILTKCLNCETGITASPCQQCDTCVEITEGRFPDLYEVDAASRTKVDDTRELLEGVQYAPTKGRFKVYLIDEVHMLSGHSFNALLKTLEEPPPHVKFLLATTEHHKIPATVLSRCLQFHLLTISVEQLVERCQHILKQEQIPFEMPALTYLAEAAQGSMRDALSLLDQSIAYGNGQVLLSDVRAMLGAIDEDVLFIILDALSNRDGSQLLHAIQQLSQVGADFSKALIDLLSLLHKITVIQLVSAHISSDERLSRLSKAITPQDAQLFYQIGLQGLHDLEQTSAMLPQVHFEMTVLRMLAFYLDENPRSQHSWPTLLPQLHLTGAALALAEHCCLQSHTESRWQFCLSTKKKPLLQETQIKKIEAALAQYFNHPIKVVIQLSDQDDGTPAALRQQQANDQQVAVRRAIMSDPNVQKIIETFNADLIKN